MKELKDISFTAVQSRLLRTIQVKHNQAMMAEINSALVDIYAELKIDPKDVGNKYELKADWSGLRLLKEETD